MVYKVSMLSCCVDDGIHQDNDIITLNTVSVLSSVLLYLGIPFRVNQMSSHEEIDRLGQVLNDLRHFLLEPKRLLSSPAVQLFTITPLKSFESAGHESHLARVFHIGSF